MTQTYWELNKFDIETRIADEGRPDPRKLLIAKDITDDGVVLQTADVKVTAFRTPHPPIMDNFAYKFETPDGMIVFSSDTDYNPKLAEFAKGADVLVHEAIYLPWVDRLVARVQERRDAEEASAGQPHRRRGRRPHRRCRQRQGAGDEPSRARRSRRHRRRLAQRGQEDFKGRIIVARDLMELKLPL